MMRADPDILMVGEIRDRETAQIAIEGALTGHMVLSTLHTNDAPSAITRLVEMGIEPFLVASAIDCVVAQRLARTLCPHCKRRTIVSAEVLREHGFRAQFDIEAYEPAGCVRCGGMGYRGRLGLYEVMTMSEEIRALTLKRASAEQIGAVAVREGMRRLRDDGLDKVKAGLTSMAEVARVTGDRARAVAAPSRLSTTDARNRFDILPITGSDAHTAAPEGNLGCNWTSPKFCSRSSTAEPRTCT